MLCNLTTYIRVLKVCKGMRLLPVLQVGDFYVCAALGSQEGDVGAGNADTIS